MWWKKSIENCSQQTRIFINQHADTNINTVPPHTSNKVISSKYSIFTFLPKNFYEQFRQIANFYFLFLVILQTFNEFSTVDFGLIATPLIIVVGFTALKDAVEDWKRHVADNSVNNAPAYCLRVKAEFESYSLSGLLKNLWSHLSIINWLTEKKKYPSKLGPLDYLSQEDFDRKDDNPLLSRKDIRREVPHWSHRKWQDVRVGDFVLIRNDEPIPADVIILSTSEDDSLCYIETKNLDGETNLKVRQGIHTFSHVKQPEQCMNIRGYIDTEYPTSNMYNYNGTAVLCYADGDPSTIPLGINTVLLRGCILRNTRWIIGIVFAVGGDTKLMRNQGSTPSKRSRIDRQLNPQIMLNFMILFVLCLICGVLGAVYQGAFNYNKVLFAPTDADTQTGANNAISHPAFIAVITFFYCMIIFQNIIPIAIYISVDIAKSFQSIMIYHDIEMCEGNIKNRALPRSWNLCDDLGQIEYIFSDKTGTLTCNIMSFRKCSINGVLYGNSFISEASFGATMRNESSSSGKEAFLSKMEAERTKLEGKMRELMGTMFDTKYISKNSLTFIDCDIHRHVAEGLRSGGRYSGGAEQAAAIIEFFTLLAVCHTVLVEVDEEDAHSLEYKAQSPDEAALVAGARDVGFTFLRRQENRVEVDIMGTTKVFHILHVLEFNSDRKRMSVIVRKEGDSDAVLLCKGADSVIYERLRRDTDEKLLSVTTSHLESFANEGLRTLCLAYKIIPSHEYVEWAERYLDAQAKIIDRDEQVETVANEVERNLTLMGATAIEDRLQDGVPECIATLAKAGIKIWVLTGDKMETAINIGFACNLLKKDMTLIVVKSADSEEVTRKQLTDALTMFWSAEGTPLRGESYGLIIDGDSLKYAFEPACKSYFLELACRCRAVICCRVSPLQKAQVVSLVKFGLSAMCLAIGDGANDVSMIQMADVGIGIGGKEGLQAVMASDYAISQFRFLSRLLLVHGRWAYMRTAELILNYFYKNVVWLFVLFWYQFDNGFTGDIITDFTYGMFFNTVFTLLPNMALGMIDQDVNDRISLQVPQLYQTGIRQTLYNMERFWFYIFDAIFQSVICYYSAVLLFVDATTDPMGYDAGKEAMGTFIAFYAVFTVNLYMGFNNFSWNWITHVCLWLTIVLFVSYVIFYSMIYQDYPGPAYGIVQMVFKQPAFYLSVALTIVVCLFPRFVFKYAQQTVAPNDIDIVQEYQKYIWKEGEPVNLDVKKRRKNSKKPVIVGPPGSSVDMLARNESDLETEEKSLKRSVSQQHVPEHTAASLQSIRQKGQLRRPQSDPTLHQIDSKVVGSMVSSLIAPASPSFVKDVVSPASLVFSAALSEVPPSPGSSYNHETFADAASSSAGAASLSRKHEKSSSSIHNILIHPLTAISKKTGEFVKSVPRRLRLGSNASRRNVAPPNRSMVFMGTSHTPTQEVTNTGFCFSHDGGMEEVITPMRTRRESIYLERTPSLRDLPEEGRYENLLNDVDMDHGK